MEKKAVVGNLIFDVFKERLTLINAQENEETQMVALFVAQPGDQKNPTIEIEQNFFKLMHILTKNSLQNSNHVKEIKS